MVRGAKLQTASESPQSVFLLTRPIIKMNKLLIAALFGLLLLSAPFVRGEEAEKEDEYEDDSASEDSKGGDDEEKDVVVITTKNWDDTVKKAPFALVCSQHA